MTSSQTQQRSRKPTAFTPPPGPEDGGLVRHNLGHYYSRTSAVKICNRLGGRLPYRRELYGGVVPHGRLLINGGAPLSSNMWVPVLDGDPSNDNEAVGWVQVGDGCFRGTAPGQNHHEAHNEEPQWGGPVYAAWKDIVWCMLPESSPTEPKMTNEMREATIEIELVKVASQANFKQVWANRANFKQALRYKLETQRVDTEVESAAQQVAKDIVQIAGAVALAVADFDLAVLQNKLQVSLQQHSESGKVSDWLVNEASMALLVVDVDKRFKQQAGPFCWGSASGSEIKAVGETVCILASSETAFQELQAALNASGVAVLKDLQDEAKSIDA